VSLGGKSLNRIVTCGCTKTFGMSLWDEYNNYGSKLGEWKVHMALQDQVKKSTHAMVRQTQWG
jgi:hypothetical protein